jgi:hypothetical protein
VTAPVAAGQLPQPAQAPSTRPAVRPAPARHSHWATVIVLAVACALSVTAYLHFYTNGQTIAYGDAKSHLLIARRVLFADTPGVGQIGGVWLPLPHILMLPLVWNDWAYYSGFAGSVVMMACYLLGTLFAFKIAWRVTRSYWAAAAAAATFALNPNILYLQSTPMTELLMFATMLGAVYGLVCWAQSDQDSRYHHLYLLGAGLSALACGFTRYEGWFLAVALIAAVLLGALPGRAGPGLLRLWRLTRGDWHLAEGQAIAFGILALAAPVAWALWNWAIFGSPLAFQTGQYAKPSNWVNAGEKAVHHWWIALRTYSIASVDNVTGPIVIVALLGLAAYLWRTRLSRDSLPVLALLVMFPMFVVMLEKGERPLHVPPYYSGFYNVRFGLIMLLPACLLAGFVAHELGGGVLARLVPAGRAARWWVALRAALRAAPSAALIGGVAFIAVTALGSGQVVTLQEAVQAAASPTEEHADAAAAWLRSHYSGGLVLMESYGNEDVAFASRVPLGEQVYEGSYLKWAPALANPSGHGITWVVMRDEPGDTDQVYQSLHGSSLLDGYRLVWSNFDYMIYKARG